MKIVDNGGPGKSPKSKQLEVAKGGRFGGLFYVNRRSNSADYQSSFTN